MLKFTNVPWYKRMYHRLISFIHYRRYGTRNRCKYDFSTLINAKNSADAEEMLKKGNWVGESEHPKETSVNGV